MRRSTSTTVFGCAAVLLSYPEATFAEDLEAVARALENMPAGKTRTRLGELVESLALKPAVQAAACYVDTFDLRRGVSLYLTYYRHGDTRERGTALAALVDAYRSAGYKVVSGELPDFLPALLELAASHPAGASLLKEHRVALDALALALEQIPSPYASAVSAILDALPPASRADRHALARYRAQGPPTERVGLEPFGPPELLGQEPTRA